MKLLLQAVTKFASGSVFMGLLLFLPAGTLKFINAWIFLALLLIPMFIAGIVLYFKNPLLLQKRLNAKEKENTQKLVVSLSGLMFLLGFIVAGLNFRFKWSNIPDWIIFIAWYNLFNFLHLLRRSCERKYISFKNHRSSKESKGNRHRTVWYS